MKIDFKDIAAGVSVECQIGAIPIEGTYESIGYFVASGEYKAGSAGAPDAAHIAGMMAYAQERFFHSSWIIDLSKLAYVWGDEMDWVLDVGGVLDVDRFAIVVGPKCMAAISTLEDPKAEADACLKAESTFDDIEEAFVYLVAQRST
jgi:hypothetical protein